jgi:hypothetical protein
MIYHLYLIALILQVASIQLYAQSENSAFKFTGIVYDERFTPIPYTHVIAIGTGQGDMTDSLGIFTIYIRESDRLSFYNITCHDSVVSVTKDQKTFYIKLRRRVYKLKEAKIFDWGSSYEDFKEEVNRQGVPQSQGEKMGLPTQDPDAIPFDLDEKKIKSPGFLLASPISFFYYNLSKHEKGIRKAYKLKQDEELIHLFEATLSSENISRLTELKGEELEEFMVFLNSNLRCNYHCGEIDLLSEIFALWEKYKSIHQ